MAFLADYFYFDGTSCDTYDLILASIGGSSDSNASFASGPTISDDYLPRNTRAHFYGVSRPDKLSFQFTCVLNACRIESGQYLTRDDIAAIAQWLTGPNTYRWLEFDQPDMYQHFPGRPGLALYKYRCLITGLDLIFQNDYPVGFLATVTCDSPYAYRRHAAYDMLVIAGETETIDVENPSTPEVGIKPLLHIRFGGTEMDPIGDITIVNQTTGETLSLTDIPTSVSTIEIDCERGVISTNAGVNLYDKFNFVFPKLVRGQNTFLIDNSECYSDIAFDISFDPPVDIGA